MTQDDLLALLGRGLRHLTPAAQPRLTPESDLHSAGIDSLQLLELVTWTEKELDIRLPDEKLYSVTDVAGLCDLISAELDDRAAS
ncbi:phosphopantetheine binding protein [Nocardia tenerifensis]|uniref:Phosphopantetheine binding protein n=1 Tax=Nocardia tenerifensis TaxID=228006 RepID=A0A318KEX5_9NOCA|nr:acyl carrier protein [Nocardia tenerifensis]PXX71369.1 phosphopantetheine binding protein [Nocardia tenerifensis]